MPAGSHSGPESSNCCSTHMDCLAPVHCDPCRLQAVVPCIERAAWAACAEGAVLPRLRRAVTALGTKAVHGGPGGLGAPSPRPLAARRAGDPPLPPQKQKRPEEGEFFRPGRPPKAAPHCLPACASGAGSRLWRNMVCAVRPSPQKDARQGAMAKIQSVPVPARKDRHGTGPNPRHRAAAAGAGTGRPSGRPPRPGPWR